MAKSKSSKRSNLNSHRAPIRTGRDVVTIARRQKRLPRSTAYRTSVTLGEDRRTFHPEGKNRPVFASPRYAARIMPKDIRVGHANRNRPNSSWGSAVFVQPRQTKAILAFDMPDKVAVCVRRNRRKEVLHALGKAGSGGMRKPRRNATSAISCR